MDYTNWKESQFYCTECGNENIIVFRNRGKGRRTGHLKKLYCVHCKKEVNCAEVSYHQKYSYEDFMQEFSLGRFVNGKRVPIEKLRRCKEKCPYRINGRCWNANNSYNCGKK